nr:hypothetical protein [Brevundimonas aurantiaca]
MAELEHGGLTEGGSLRHAAFKGLREDKRAQEVVDDPQPPSPKQAEKAAPTPRRTGKDKVVVAGVTLSSPDKVLWPAVGGRPAITKTDLARYYEQAAERILPHVADRPVSIIRAPDGIEGETFFQRHAMPGSNPRLKLIDVHERKPYVAVVDVGGWSPSPSRAGLSCTRGAVGPAIRRRPNRSPSTSIPTRGWISKRSLRRPRRCERRWRPRG